MGISGVLCFFMSLHFPLFLNTSNCINRAFLSFSTIRERFIFINFLVFSSVKKIIPQCCSLSSFWKKIASISGPVWFQTLDLLLLPLKSNIIPNQYITLNIHYPTLPNFNIQVAQWDLHLISKILLDHCSIHPGLFVFPSFSNRKFSLGWVTAGIKSL